MRRMLMTGLVMLLGIVSPTQARSVERFGSYSTEEAMSQVTPTLIDGFSEVTAISTSETDSYFLQNAKAFAEGNNGAGQLGDGTHTNSSTPVEVKFPAGVVIVSLAENMGKEDGMAISAEGVAYAWGSDGAGSACSDRTDLTLPREVATGIKAATSAGPHTLLLTDENTILVCGSNKEGELGLGKGVSEVKKPSPLSGLTDVCAISAGEFTGEALKCDGEVWMWGNNRHGAVGVGSSAATIFTPERVELPEPAIAIYAGGSSSANGSSLAITHSHKLYTWGAGAKGQLGNGETKDEPSPVPATEFSSAHVAEAVTGGANTLVRTDAGELLGVGANGGGGLGQGSTKGTTTLTPVFVDSGVESVAATAENVLETK